MLQDVADLNLPDCDGVASILASGGLCFQFYLFFCQGGRGCLWSGYARQQMIKFVFYLTVICLYT
jgi:hypothetical protein